MVKLPLPFYKKRQQTDYKETIVGFINDEYTRRRQERRPWELQWRLNLEFLAGNQYVEIHPRTQDLVPLPRFYEHQEREPINKILPIVEVRVNRLARSRTRVIVRPYSGDQHDKLTAKISGEVINANFQEQDFPRKLRNGLLWLETTGTIFIKPFWNPLAGRLIFRAERQRSQEEIEAMKETELETADMTRLADLFNGDQEVLEIYEGDVEQALIPCFEVFPDSCWHQEIKDCHSIIHARAYHVDWIYSNLGIKVKPEEVDVLSLQETTSGGIGGLGYGYGGYRTAVRKLKGHAIVKEYYERPSVKYLDGRFIIIVGGIKDGEVAHVGSLPYRNGKNGRRDLPLIKIVSSPMPGMFWGQSTVERLIPLQRRYNALRNRKTEYLNMVAIGQWTEPVGSLEEGSELNNAGGNIIRYYPARGKPEPVKYPDLPRSYEEEVQQLDNEFIFLSGASEISLMSQAPPGVKAGISLDIALQQDDVRLSGTSTRIEEGVAETGKHVLRLYKERVAETRIARVVSDEGDIALRSWRQSDLTSDDVIVEGGPGLFDTPAQRREMVIQLLQYGLFNDPETGRISSEGRERVFEILEMGNWETADDDEARLQRLRAKRENQGMLAGTPAQVRDYDDHFIHIQQHNRERLQAEYEALRSMPGGPLIDALFEEHVGAHFALVVQLAMQQLKQQQMAGAGEKEVMQTTL